MVGPEGPQGGAGRADASAQAPAGAPLGQAVHALPFKPPPPSVYFSDYDASTPRSTRVADNVVEGGAADMDQLKAAILAADTGTGAVAQIIQAARFTPRHNAFTILLQVASRSRQPEKAVEIFAAMQAVGGIAPNTFSYSALISALAKVGNWQEAEVYFKDLREKAAVDPNMRPNTVTYAAMISGEWRGLNSTKWTPGVVKAVQAYLRDTLNVPTCLPSNT